MKKLTMLTILLAVTAGTGSVLAQKTKNTPVTSRIADSDVNFAPLSIQSDVQGAYQNGVNSVVSQIQSIGDWELDMLASPARRALVTFNDPVPNTNPNNLPAPPSSYYPVRFLTQCGVNGFNLNTLAQNATATCPLIVAVDVSGVRYSLRFYSRNYPGTNDVPVTCTSAASGSCTGWRMQSPNGTGKLIAQLLKVTTKGNTTTTTDYGKYYFSFDASFNNP